MKLIKWPSTEMEYYNTMEGLGGFIFRMSHEISRGHIKDSNNKVKKDIKDANKIQSKISKEIAEKFGVVFPEGRAPLQSVDDLPVLSESKEYYINWYFRMKKEEAEGWFKKTICFACPLSNKNRFIGNDVCDKYSINEKTVDLNPKICWAAEYPHFKDFEDQDGFFEYIRVNHGEDAVSTIKKHLESL
jgi:hypothetical protein